ncbi:MAG: DNA-directed RNA polymerase subunit omega [Firmicutes bacterium]|nr:DNA-directed RNA polymerase subunit omega [Bacillota bacterium]
MLKPSYAELMDVLNKNTEKNDEVTSRYTIVIAAAKRARQLIDGDSPMVEEKKGKPLSTAVEEIAEGKIQVVPEGEGTVLEIYRQKELKEEMEKELAAHSGNIDNDFLSQNPDNNENDEISDDDFDEDSEEDNEDDSIDDEYIEEDDIDDLIDDVTEDEEDVPEDEEE